MLRVSLAADHGHRLADISPSNALLFARLERNVSKFSLEQSSWCGWIDYFMSARTGMAGSMLCAKE
jgi:hypothetical protein